MLMALFPRSLVRDVADDLCFCRGQRSRTGGAARNPSSTMNATITVTDRAPSRAVRLALFVCSALPGAWLAAQCGAGLGAAVAHPDDGSPILWMLVLLAMSVLLLLLGTRTTHQRMFVLAFLPMLTFTPMAYQLSVQNDSLSFLTAFVGVISPAVIIPILVWHYRNRAEQALSTVNRQPSTNLSAINYQPSWVMSDE